jgi:branched-chain amino acid transport system ATP-binding protein
LRERGTPILLVEQNARKALELADRGLVLRSGATALTGSAAQLLQDEHLRSAYLGGTAALSQEPPLTVS